MSKEPISTERTQIAREILSLLDSKDLERSEKERVLKVALEALRL